MNNGRADRGWTWLVNSVKWHYFENGQSLCGEWGYLGQDFHDFADVPEGVECPYCRKAILRKAEQTMLT